MSYLELTSKTFFLLVILTILTHYGQCGRYQRSTKWGTWSNKITCGSHYIVCGIQVRIQTSQWWWDDTSVNGLRIFCCRQGYLIRGTKEYTGIWGSWATVQMCDSRNGQQMAVSGIRFKTQPDNQDNTAVCGFRIKCRSVTSPIRNYDNYFVLRTQSQWGDWQDWLNFKRNEWMVGVRVKFQNRCWSCDDTALTGLEIFTT